MKTQIFLHIFARIGLPISFFKVSRQSSRVPLDRLMTLTKKLPVAIAKRYRLRVKMPARIGTLRQQLRYRRVPQ